MLWMACTQTGTFASAGFAFGTLGSMNCPANYFRIVTEDMCRSAAAAAGQACQGRETSVVSPRGCNLYEEGEYLKEGGVFLSNATGTGQRPSQATLLCSVARLLSLYDRRGS